VHHVGNFVWLAEELLASPQELCCMEGVSKREKVTVRYFVGIALQIRKNCELQNFYRSCVGGLSSCLVADALEENGVSIFRVQRV